MLSDETNTGNVPELIALKLLVIVTSERCPIDGSENPTFLHRFSSSEPNSNASGAREPDWPSSNTKRPVAPYIVLRNRKII
jgi:hypothetical protein